MPFSFKSTWRRPWEIVILDLVSPSLVQESTPIRSFILASVAVWIDGQSLIILNENKREPWTTIFPSPPASKQICLDKMGISNLHDELRDSTKHVIVQTKYGEIIGARACTGAAAFLGSSWIFSQELKVQNFSIVRGSICIASRAVSRSETLTSRISVPKESVHHWVGVCYTTHERWPGTKQDYYHLHNHSYWVASIGRSFKDKVGHGQPTENPYVMKVSYCDLY